jgi:hypothetical protein
MPGQKTVAVFCKKIVRDLNDPNFATAISWIVPVMTRDELGELIRVRSVSRGFPPLRVLARRTFVLVRYRIFIGKLSANHKRLGFNVTIGAVHLSGNELCVTHVDINRGC